MSLTDRLARRRDKDPYEGLPTDELAEPLLPRWFVLLALVTVPVALALFVYAFFGFGRAETPVAERRPPPAQQLTSDVGALVVGDRPPRAHDAACPDVDGVLVAGTERDRAHLGAGLDALCAAPPEARGAIAALDGAELRFAAFEASGVDVTGSEETVYVNARFSQQPADLIAPLVAYQAVVTRGDAAEARTVLAARRAELLACDALLDTPGRACEDARELLELDDSVAELEDAGFR